MSLACIQTWTKKRMFYSLFRLYNLDSSFLTKANIKQVMKLLQITQKAESMVQYSHTYIYCTYISGHFLFPLLVTYSMVIRPFITGSFTAPSKSGPDTSLSPSNQKLTNTSSTYPHMDYMPFIRCSAAFSPFLSCFFSFFTSILLLTLLGQHEYKVRMMMREEPSQVTRSHNCTLQNSQFQFIAPLGLLMYLSLIDLSSA